MENFCYVYISAYEHSNASSSSSSSSSLLLLTKHLTEVCGAFQIIRLELYSLTHSTLAFCVEKVPLVLRLGPVWSWSCGSVSRLSPIVNTFCEDENWTTLRECTLSLQFCTAAFYVHFLNLFSTKIYSGWDIHFITNSIKLLVQLLLRRLSSGKLV
uniref:Uncharacterized protein n=1 Tax=Glossina palpalis gambiensis TaxID=67801 RepID=A0A1B0BLE8_9MUSC